MKFSDIKVGQEVSLTREITQKDVNSFVQLTGDTNPIHLIHTDQLGDPIVHGMLTASYISTVIGTMLPGYGTLWKKQTLAFVEPVYVGDEIKVTVHVIGIYKDKKELRLITDITKQDGRTVVYGEALVKLYE